MIFPSRLKLKNSVKIWPYWWTGQVKCPHFTAGPYCPARLKGLLFAFGSTSEDKFSDFVGHFFHF